jgi:hypothetical protein
MAFTARRSATLRVGNRLERAERARPPVTGRFARRRRGDARAERLVELFGLAFADPR